MADAATALTAVVASWLLTYLLHSSVLLGGAWGVVRLFALQPRSRDFLWRIALLGGLVTATGSVWSATEAPPRLDVVRRDLVEEGRGPHWIGGERSIRVRANVTSPSPECRAVLREPGFATPGWPARVGEVCSSRSGRSWPVALVAVWLVGAILGVGLLALRYLALSDVRASLDGVGPRTSRAFAVVSRGVARVHVRSSALLATPCVISSRTIVIPEHCEVELTDEELRAALAHELAHVARADVAWSWLLRCVAAVGWMQPLNRIGVRAALEAAEEACDDWALARTGERRGLASSIRRVAEWVAEAPHRPTPVSIAGSDPGPASRRIRRILSRPTRPEPAWLKSASVALIAAPLLLLPPVATPRGPHASLVVARRIVIDERPEASPPAPAVGDHVVLVTRRDPR